ncbi:hypothetical protein E4U54_004366 [Claviceps lovelessii]|nr:hypothetical protein E4U54_004366 [Claviceps lovelessii]
MCNGDKIRRQEIRDQDVAEKSETPDASAQARELPTYQVSTRYRVGTHLSRDLPLANDGLRYSKSGSWPGNPNKGFLKSSTKESGLQKVISNNISSKRRPHRGSIPKSLSSLRDASSRFHENPTRRTAPASFLSAFQNERLLLLDVVAAVAPPRPARAQSPLI